MSDLSLNSVRARIAAFERQLTTLRNRLPNIDGVAAEIARAQIADLDAEVMGLREQLPALRLREAAQGGDPNAVIAASVADARERTRQDANRAPPSRADVERLKTEIRAATMRGDFNLGISLEMKLSQLMLRDPANGISWREEELR